MSQFRPNISHFLYSFYLYCMLLLELEMWNYFLRWLNTLISFYLILTPPQSCLYCSVFVSTITYQQSSALLMPYPAFLSNFPTSKYRLIRILKNWTFLVLLCLIFSKVYITYLLYPPYHEIFQINILHSSK